MSRRFWQHEILSQDADHPFDFVPNGEYRRIGEGDSFRWRFILTGEMFCNSVTAKSYARYDND